MTVRLRRLKHLQSPRKLHQHHLRPKHPSEADTYHLLSATVLRKALPADGVSAKEAGVDRQVVANLPLVVTNLLPAVVSTTIRAGLHRLLLVEVTCHRVAATFSQMVSAAIVLAVAMVSKSLAHRQRRLLVMASTGQVHSGALKVRCLKTNLIGKA